MSTSEGTSMSAGRCVMQAWGREGEGGQAQLPGLWHRCQSRWPQRATYSGTEVRGEGAGGFTPVPELHLRKLHA